jgi:hypothetical protein
VHQWLLVILIDKMLRHNNWASTTCGKKASQLFWRHFAQSTRQQPAVESVSRREYIAASLLYIRPRRILSNFRPLPPRTSAINHAFRVVGSHNHNRPPPNFRNTFGTTMLSEANWIYEIHTTSYVVACICGSSEMNKYYSTSGHRVPWEKNRDLSCCCLQQHQNKCNTRCPDIWRNRHGAIKLQLGRSTWERNESSVTIAELRFQAELITWRASNNQLTRQQTVHLKW